MAIQVSKLRFDFFLIAEANFLVTVEPRLKTLKSILNFAVFFQTTSMQSKTNVLENFSIASVALFELYCDITIGSCVANSKANQ